ncbi:MAG: iron ABC transporter permease [Pseudomonadota bacterium]|nr:iron ABC transporter permease [Pseudomonadota bacterium]
MSLAPAGSSRPARGLRAALPGRAALALPALGVLAAALALAELVYGPVHLSPARIWAALRGEGDAAAQAILMQIRLPRLGLGVAAGAALALSGAALQGVLRNPLADPGLIGVTGGAAAAAVAMIVLGGGLVGGLVEAAPWLSAGWALPMAAFAGASAVTAFVFAAARAQGTTSVATLILAGVAVNAIAFAFIGAMSFISDDAQLRELTFWNLGGLGGAAPGPILAAGAAAAAAGIGLMRLARGLDLLQLGERAAFHAGLDVERAKFAAAAWSALAVGAVTAAAGPIGFVGLVGPHLARLLVGPGHARLLPAAALAGVSLVLGADLVVRTAVPPAEPPIGLATSLIGGPFFLWLLVRRQRRGGGDA